MKNKRLINALLRKPVDKTPVWIMRQAGRYLPEYRELRAKAGSFMNLCMNPELACEVTMQPLRRFDLDAAILFSDILTIPDAMGLGLEFVKGEGPQFANPVRTQKDVDRIGVIDPEQDLKYVMDAVRLIRKELNGEVPLIGFAGSPWTVATYAVEGSSSKTFSIIKKMLYSEPKILHELLDKLADSTAAYLNAQIAAGAQAVMIFDTWGGVLSPEAYYDFSLTYMQKVVDQLTRNVDGEQIPVTLFTKQASQYLEMIANSGCDAVGVDWTISLNDARARVGNKVALQGNLDPSTLYSSPENIRKAVKRTLESFGDHPGHVFNLGHGIYPDVNPEHLKVLVDAVHEFSAR